MSGRGNWTTGYGYLCLSVCLLLLCPPLSCPALVFPNDVLADLDKYRTNSNSYEHIPKGKTTSPVSFSSFGATPPFHSDKVSPLPSQPVPLQHSYSSPEGTPVPSNNPNHHNPPHHGPFNKDLFHSFPSISEESAEDYDDYSDLSQPLSQSQSVDLPLKPNSKESITPKVNPPHGHHPSLSSSLPELPEQKEPSGSHDGDSREEEEEKARGKQAGNKMVEVPQYSHSSNPKKPEDQKQCPRCKIRQEDRAYRIEALKQSILRGLHFTTLPNRTRTPVPKALAHVSGIHSELLQDAPNGGGDHPVYDDEDEDYTPPERVFTMAKTIPHHLGREDNRSCYFTIPDEVFRSRMSKAFIWFYVRHTRAVQSSVIQMRLARLGPSFSKKQRPSRRIMWSQKDYPDKAFGWKKVEVTNVVRRWIKHPSSNYGLQIQAMNGNENLAVLPPTSEEFKGYEPMLDIKVTKNPKRRYKRSDSLTCSENTTEHRCCRYALSVSFAEFGWDWVIAPLRVKADFCSGECRMTLQNETPHSWITSQTPQGGSCCRPSKMSALSLLYYDHNDTVVYQNLQNMRVERCGCA
ncbi:hypothetical protein ACOMHN_054486 [Nucella lapillus]